jgi:hypothetical protein
LVTAPRHTARRASVGLPVCTVLEQAANATVAVTQAAAPSVRSRSGRRRMNEHLRNGEKGVAE